MVHDDDEYDNNGGQINRSNDNDVDDEENDEEGEEDEEDEVEDDEDDDDNKRDGSSTVAVGSHLTSSQPTETERLTVHSYGSLDVSAIDDDCWLIRIPQSVYEVWENADEGVELGDLVFTKGGGTGVDAIKPSITVNLDEGMVKEQMQRNSMKKKKKSKTVLPHLQQQQPTVAMIPLHYSLQAMTKKVPVLHPFVRNPITGRVQLLGTVSRTANLQVERADSSYRTLLKNRLVSTMTVNKFVKPVEANDSILTKQRKASSSVSASIPNSSSSRKSFGDAVYQFGKRKLESIQDSNVSSFGYGNNQASGPNNSNKKMSRHQFAPDQPLRSVLFELFQQQQYWTIKDLKAAAVAGGALAATNNKRAEAEIREILREEIGEYHRSGDHKNKWELRKEFQQYNNTNTSGSVSNMNMNAANSKSGSGK